MSGEVMDELRAALDDWQADYDEGWGDRFASGDSSEGGFSLNDHNNWAKEFRLLRAARAFLDAKSGSPAVGGPVGPRRAKACPHCVEPCPLCSAVPGTETEKTVPE